MSTSTASSDLKIVKEYNLPDNPFVVQRHMIEVGTNKFRRISFRTTDGGKTFEALEDPWWQQKSNIDGEWFNCNEGTTEWMETCFQRVWSGSKSPYDRGKADSYYHRGPDPHYYHPFHGRLEKDDMSPDQITRYHTGYNDNERDGDFKEYE